MALDESIVASVANANFKTLAEAGITQFLGHQARLQILAEKALAKSVESMDSTSVSEGLGESIAAVTGFQQAIKGAGNTPPVTP